ncbi:GntR family transcriptional regulator [Streptomyces sp. INA 01156]
MIAPFPSGPRWRTNCADGWMRGSTSRGEVPGTVDIAAEFDVSQSTAQKAVAALRSEGRLYTVLGQGSFVKGDA